MSIIRWKDEPYEIGGKTVRLNSIEHLRTLGR